MMLSIRQKINCPSYRIRPSLFYRSAACGRRAQDTGRPSLQAKCQKFSCALSGTLKPLYGAGPANTRQNVHHEPYTGHLVMRVSLGWREAFLPVPKRVRGSEEGGVGAITSLLSAATPRSRSTVSFVWTGSCGDAAHTLSQKACTLAFSCRAFVGFRRCQCLCHVGFHSYLGGGCSCFPNTLFVVGRCCCSMKKIGTLRRVEFEGQESTE